MYSFDTVDLRIDGPIATMTLNRPQAANSLNRQLMDEGIAALDAIRACPEVDVVILTGAGERHFCAGADLRDSSVTATGPQVIDPPRRLIHEVERLPQPVIAAINGAAMGGGCELALASDLRIMADTAKIGLTEIAFGALPAGGGTQRLPRLIGAARAKELIYLGRRLDAGEALNYGLVTEVVPAAQLAERARAIAEELAEKAGYALRTAKFLINEGAEMNLASALQFERKMIQRMATPEERQAAIERASRRSGTYDKIFKSAER